MNYLKKTFNNGLKGKKSAKFYLVKSLDGIDAILQIQLTESKNQHKVTLTSESDLRSY
jgi:hypothetical protein